MVLRFLVYAIMALALGGFGTVAYLTMRAPDPMQAGAPPPPPVRVTVLAAGRALRAGSLLKPEDLVAKQIPTAQAGADTSADTPAARSALFGAMIRRSVAEGEPITAPDVLHPGDHGFLAAVLGAGMRAYTLSFDSVESDASLLWPGDRVDIVLTQTDDGAPAGRRTSGRTLLTDIRVIAVDQRLVQGAAGDEKGGGAKTLTLEVTQEQVERLAVARRLGKLVLSTRAADQPSSPDGLLGLFKSPSAPVWASDVAPGLVETAPKVITPPTVRVYSGSGEGKEYRF